MISSVLAQQLQQGVEDFLRTTFPVSTPHFEGVLDRLLDEDGSIFKGPYLSLQLPFELGTRGDSSFLHVSFDYQPYRHQEEAFDRLVNDTPRSTLVATGTGSGKTEAFLLPILEYCYARREETGIKAIVIYPMNALANDQAGRIARLVAEDETLAGAVRAGLYIGQRDQASRKAMDTSGIITDRTTLRLDPPDILLTNYKMLDYLLIRPDDLSLWEQNGPETLRYLVVDELHTFDGAQGTDLACLIRRLKARLGTPEGHLCCVGTSATLGGDDARQELVEYAGDIFGEPFDTDAVIMESRQSVPEFLGDSLVHSFGPVPPEKAEALSPAHYSRVEEYLRAQVDLWFGDELVIDGFDSPRWRVELGELLKAHPLFRNLLTVLGGKIRSLDEVQRALGRATPELRDEDEQYRRDLLDSLIALVSAARSWGPRPTRGDEIEEMAADRPTLPFLDVRLQLWLRELRRMVASVGEEPRLAFFDDLTEQLRGHHLPVVQCRDCGSTGWGGTLRQQDERLQSDLKSFYQGFFGNSPNVKFFFPDDPQAVENLAGTWAYVDEHLKVLGAKPDGPAIGVFLADNVRQGANNRHYGHHDCPYCGSKDALTILGSRAASLTSVLITQLYASGYNEHKKLITFADSVQDASHRAGFYSARTYRFNVRTALQTFVNQLGDDGMAALTLGNLSEAFSDYWKAQLDEREFVATFIAPDMTWLESYEHLTEHNRLPAGSDLVALVRKRISWEIFSEYGYRARIGRTLEKSGASIAYPDRERVEAAMERLLHVLPNEFGGFSGLEPDSLRPFLVGILSHMRTQGGIYHEAVGGFVSSGGNTYHLTRIPFMPGYGRHTRAPTFLTTGSHRNFDGLHSGGGAGSATWYESWAEKCLTPINPLVSSVLLEFYHHVIDALLESGLLEERQAKGDPVWGIPPHAIRISRKVAQFRCDRCGHVTAAAGPDTSDWTGAPCLRFRCTGHYNPTDAALDYYGKLYSTGDVQRIITAEHTGLLDRDTRERLESRFQKAEHPWDPNLLSATPTLEMGIDIGDLSTVILGSIPPSEANYIQRIGRSGRRDGSALNLAVASGRPHDLYFYAEPREMIEGEIRPPGVFLRAAAVLERQLTGFCFDRWVESGIPAKAIPTNLRSVLDELDQKNSDEFPHNFLAFVGERREALVDAFLDLFEDRLGDEAEAHMRWFGGLEGPEEGTLDYKLLDGLHGLKKEREGLQKNIRRLRRRIRAMEEQEVRDLNYEEELNELRGERTALQRIVREKIDQRHTLNFLTDEGLIPNYAFPEAGVTLRSLIYRKRGDDEDGGWETRVYEYERPAVSAISELAPANRFYAEGRNVRVDQIDLTVADIEEWRFCDNCSYSALQVEGDTPSVCPRCESTQWADAGQQQPMVRMRQVFASESERRSRTTDDSDDRRPVFFNKQLLVDYDENDITSAFLIDDDELPFGFEFLSKVSLREVNFGELSLDGQPLRIAGVESPRKGFTICRHCGKVQPRSAKAEHAISCPARNSDDEKDFQECLYLYREFSSEGIRVLLPETTFSGSEQTLHSFIAALQLGLRKTFRGKIDHLQVADFEEPIPGLEHRKRSLVLYDTVPGGTGYLKELMRDPSPLLKVFENALDTLRSCTCNEDPDKDGCYRCLYAYRNSYDMEETSRDRAIGLLSSVLKRREKLVEIEKLRDAKVNALLESELEGRFIDLLNASGTEEQPVSVASQIVHSKPGYFLKTGEESYYIEPQVELGVEQAVGIPSRADFVISPARMGSNAKPIAVFVDGWTYHHDRIDKDLAQRIAIARSGQYHVWSLTWQDIERMGDDESDHYEDLLAPSLAVPGAVTYRQIVRGFDDQYGTNSLMDLPQHDAFSWLLRFLADPDPDAWAAYAGIQAMLLTDRDITASEERQEQWKAELEQHLPDAVVDYVRDIGIEVFGQYEYGARVRWFMAATKEGVQSLDPDAIRYIAVLEDQAAIPEDESFKRFWNGALRLLNVIQFLPGLVLSRRGIESGTFTDLDLTAVGAGPIAPPDVDGEAWREATELVLREYAPVLEAVREAGGTCPEVGYEIVDSAGRVAGMAELAWPPAELAVLDSRDETSTEAFRQAGWTVVGLAEAAADPTAFTDQYVGARTT